MIHIVYILGALNQFYTSAHWRSRGALFLETHNLFADLYSKLPEQIDSLVELLISTGMDDVKVEPQLFADEVRKHIPTGSTSNGSNLTASVLLEEELLEAIQAVKVEEVSIGVYNKLASIAEDHERNLYKLRQTLKTVKI